MAMIDKSLDDLIAEAGINRKSGRRAGGGSKGGGKGGKAGFDRGERHRSEASDPYPVNRKGGRGSGKGFAAARGGPAESHPRPGNRQRPGLEPSVDDVWVHDKYESSSGTRQFHKVSARDAPAPMSFRVHVSNLPWDWEEPDVKGVAETVAPVEKVTLYYDAAGRPTGAGMITYRSEEAARQAIKDLDTATLGANEISVAPAKMKDAGGENTKRTAGFGRAVSRYRKPDLPVRGREEPERKASREPGRPRAHEPEQKIKASKEDLDGQMEAFLQTTASD
ncbi:hypothetical protein DIPPA_19043 [Diplonema papillatum]|nr:hypothetical protein DIPPA_19043 [Diplonema papillatum]